MGDRDDFKLKDIDAICTLRPEGQSADYGKYVNMAGFHDNGMFTTGREIDCETLEAFYSSMNACGRPAVPSAK